MYWQRLGSNLKFPNFLQSPQSFFFFSFFWTPLKVNNLRGHTHTAKGVTPGLVREGTWENERFQHCFHKVTHHFDINFSDLWHCHILLMWVRILQNVFNLSQHVAYSGPWKPIHHGCWCLKTEVSNNQSLFLGRCVTEWRQMGWWWTWSLCLALHFLLLPVTQPSFFPSCSWQFARMQLIVAMLSSAAPATRFFSGAELGLKFIPVTEHIRFYCQFSPIQHLTG